ncbi:general substrate transporter [Xylogone sp. PMI_703]|nr:general substrate transporter [Xylogone sp. PMI_703]
MDQKVDFHHEEDTVGGTVVQSTMVESRMEAALMRENPSPFRKSFLRMYACIFVGYLCSATNGFDANTFGGLSAIPSFISYFGITTENQGLVAALYVIGNVAGAFFAGPCTDTYGRKVGMAIGSSICIIGAVLQAAATSLHILMAGRFILGLGAVLVQTAGPSYVVEMAYPKYRGQLTGGFQSCFFLGTIVSTWLEYGLNFIHTDKSYPWRLPLAVQGLPSILVLVFVWFIPETPRWYIGQGKIEEAKAILIKYHGDGNPDSLVVNLELEEMLEVIELEGSDKRWWDFRSLFNSRAARYRTFLITCIAWFGQLDLPPTSYYFPLMAKTAGITSVQTQLLLNAIQTPIMMVAALCGLRFIQTFGRRKLLMFSSTGMSLSVAVITACTANQAGHPAVGGTGVAFLYVFLVVFAFAWTPMQSLYPSEVLAYNTRAKGLAFMNLVVNAVNVLNTYVPPIAITNSGWKFYILYVVWDAFGVVVIYFTFIETKGWSLEEIEELFHSAHPVKRSLEKKQITVRDDGTIANINGVEFSKAAVV